MVKVSVVIKALNEEAHIAKAIDSALMAVAPWDGEVILADSLSTDRTIEIAKQYPIKIVQLTDPNDRCCGVGAQLGFQYSRGEYVYILDGDMELQKDFLTAAIELMDGKPEIAGVGGLVKECNLQSLEYQARQSRAPANMQAGYVDRLDMGGLYRRSALTQVGFFTNQNLHAYEEFDLAIRLRALNYKLYRLANHSVNHYGHTLPAFLLLKKRWKNRYLCGVGEVLRGAIGAAHLRYILSDLKELWIYGAVMVWWCAVVVAALTAGSLFNAVFYGAALLLSPLLLMAIKKRSPTQGLYSVISWNYYAAATIRGLLARQKDPAAPVASRIIQSLHD